MQGLSLLKSQWGGAIYDHSLFLKDIRIANLKSKWMTIWEAYTIIFQEIRNKTCMHCYNNYFKELKTFYVQNFTLRFIYLQQ